jgi:hypothetical protein
MNECLFYFENRYSCRYLILPVPLTNYSTDKPTKQDVLYPTYGGVTVWDQSKCVVTNFRFFFRCIQNLTVQTWRGFEIWFSNFMIVNNLDHCYLYERRCKYRLNVCSLTFVYRYVEKYAVSLSFKTVKITNVKHSSFIQSEGYMFRPQLNGLNVWLRSKHVALPLNKTVVLDVCYFICFKFPGTSWCRPS